MVHGSDSTVFVTKLTNISQTALVAYCQTYGNVVNCVIKNTHRNNGRSSYSFVQFSEVASAKAILSKQSHVINGTHILIRPYTAESNPMGSTSKSNTPNDTSQKQSNGFPLPEQQPSSSRLSSNDKTNVQQPPTPPSPSPHFEQLVQENMTLKYEVNSLRKSLVETQQYSKTAYETFQALREKFEAEQRLTSKLKMDHTAMVESYELQLKKLRETPPSSSVSPLLAPAPLPPPALSVPVEVKHKESVKDEPIDHEVHRNNLANQLLEIQIVKDRLEQAQIDLGKCQTENAILTAKLASREQQSEVRIAEITSRYNHLKKRHDYVLACVDDFHSKMNHRKRFKADVKQESTDHSRQGIVDDGSNSTNDDIVEIIMHVEPTTLPAQT